MYNSVFSNKLRKINNNKIIENLKRELNTNANMGIFQNFNNNTPTLTNNIAGTKYRDNVSFNKIRECHQL